MLRGPVGGPPRSETANEKETLCQYGRQASRSGLLSAAGCAAQGGVTHSKQPPGIPRGVSAHLTHHLYVVDTLTPDQRSRNMALIRSVDTRPELVVRRIAHAAGLRFRLHRRDLPGSPDLVFPKRGFVVFVHGCFWHRHAGCFRTTMPKTRTAFWAAKFDRNVARDRRDARRLRRAGWRVLVIWECQCRKPETIRSKLLRAAALKDRSD